MQMKILQAFRFLVKCDIYLLQKLINMAQTLEKQVLSRLKRLPCEQNQCRNLNQDNIQIIVFGKQNLKKQGLMCSQCLIDSELLQQISPVEKHALSISKFMRTLTEQYHEYAKLKDSLTWGPNMLEAQRKQIKEIMSANEQQLFKGINEIITFVKQSGMQALQEIKVLYKDKNFENLSQLLNQEDDQQERINVSKQIKEISQNILMVEGYAKLSNEFQIKEKHDKVIFQYRKNFEIAKNCMEKLIQVQKRCLKQLIK